MIRQDYLLGWIRRYIQWIAEIAGFIRREDWEAAMRRADMALRELLGLGTDSVHSLAEGEILARLTVGEPPPVVQDKCLLLAALLHQLGKIASGRGRIEEARECHLKALHVLLGLHMQTDSQALPEFVPTLAELETALQGADIPARTYAALMIYHEQAGRFGKAEDALFELLRREGSQADTLEMGEGFYRRLLVLSDEALARGGLPRAEVEAGLAELRAAPR